MSGLLALLDDVAAIAKVAATSIDDVAAQAAKAGAKAAGAVIDDAAVTPKYVHGFEASRELPIIWRIARGSLKNKLLYLLPAGMVLTTYAPWAITPLLMLGGGYLCFEGAEKVYHVFVPHHASDGSLDEMVGDPAHLEEQKAAGAIKTDFILSAEIMTIALAAIPPSNIWMEAATLAVVGIGITVVVYGSVALIVKADDVGLFMYRNGRLALTRRFGRGIVQAMPGFLRLLTNIGTAAMLWVGGSIVIHGLEGLGFGWLGHQIHDLAAMVAHQVPADFAGIVGWSAKAAMDGVVGLGLGLGLIPVVTKAIVPLWQAVTGKGRAEMP
ncbi:MAG: putative DNA repair protein MutK [Paracoccaceae bacterium]|jgi:predicted DNA repair protein MutK